MTREQKINYLVVPITLAIVVVVTIVLAICKQAWLFYLVGACLGLLNHGILVKQNARITRLTQLDPNHTIYNPKKAIAFGYFIRALLFVAVFIALVYKSDFAHDKSAIWMVVIALAGYLTIKIAFIICLLTIKEKKVEA